MGAICVFGIICSIAGFVLAQRADQARALEFLGFRADALALGLQARIVDAFDPVRAAAAFAASTDELNSKEFLAFVGRARTTDNALRAVSWAQHVTDAERPDFEATMRRDGQSDYRIVELDSQGRPVEARRRDSYTAVLTAFVQGSVVLVPGLDLMADESRRRLLERATERGGPAIGRLDPLPAGTDPVYAVYWPVFDGGAAPAGAAERRSQLRGIVGASFTISELLAAASRSVPDTTGTLDIAFKGTPGADEPLARAHYDAIRRVIVPGPTPEPAASVAAVRQTRNFDLFGSAWSLGFGFSQAEVEALRSNGPLGWLVAGLLMTFLVTVYMRRARLQLTIAERSAARHAAEASRTSERLKREVGERIDAQGRYERTARELQAVIDSAPYPIIALDRQRRVTTWSSAAERIFGYTHDEVIGRPYALVPPGREAEFTQLFDLAMAGQPMRGVFVRRRRKDGTLVDIVFSGNRLNDADGQPRGMVYALEDVTERRLTAQALQTSEARLRGLLAASPDPIVVTDSEGAITMASDRAQAVFGYSASELTGMPLTALVAPADRGTYEQRSRQDHAAVSEPLELECRRKDGGEFPAEISLSFQDGVIVAAVRDVSQRKRTESALVQAQKMEAVGQLTGGIAHDFNNLLAVVIGNLDLLSARLAGDPKAAELGADALRGALRGAELVQRLLAFSRRQALQTRTVDLRTVIDTVVPLLRRTLGEPINIASQYSDGIWPVIADPVRLEAVLLNLAVNARDAMPRGGTLTIGCANTTIDGTLGALSGELAAGDYVVVTVRDTGTGMTPQVQARVFEPFFTTKPEGQGSGLGLSMVFGTMKQSGGAVQIESAPGEGTSVRLYLPRAFDPVRPAAAPGGTEPLPLAREGERILLVEDDEQVRKISILMLGSLGYAVIAADSAAAALDRLGKGERFSLLLTDVVMAGPLNGLELAREARRVDPQQRVLFMSGFARPQLHDDGARELAAAFLNKPFRKTDLARQVRAVLDRPAAVQP